MFVKPTNRETSQRVAWGIWSLAALFYAYEFIHRLSPSAMIPELMEDFSVSASELGTLSAFYYYFYAAFQLPAGMIADRVKIRNMLICAALLVVIGSFMQTSAYQLQAAQLARALIGIGSAFAFVSCIKLGITWFSSDKLPLLVGLTNFCGVLGAIIGGSPLAYWVEEFGWRETFWYGSFVGLAITVAIFFFVRPGPIDPPRSIQATPSILDGLRQVFKCRQTWFIAFYAALLVAPIAAFAELWSIPFLMKSHDIPRTMATFANSLVFCGIAIGGPLIGWVASKRLILPTNLMRTCTLFALLCFLGILFVGHVPLWAVFLLLFCFGLFTSNMLLCFSFVTLIHPRWASGAAIGFTNTLVMAGAALFQPLIGLIIDRHQIPVFHEEMGQICSSEYQIALSLLSICLALALLVIHFIKVPESLLPRNISE